MTQELRDHGHFVSLLPGTWIAAGQIRVGEPRILRLEPSITRMLERNCGDSGQVVGTLYRNPTRRTAD